jgi:hypothetical protein
VKLTVPLPKTFRPPEPAEDWFDTFLRYVRSTSTPRARWGAVFAAYIPTEVANVIRQDLPPPEDDEDGMDVIAQTDISTLKLIFFQHYGNSMNSRRVALTLDKLQQTGTAMQYINTFDVHMSKIHDADRPSEYVLVHNFIKGFHSTRLREQLTNGPGGPGQDNYNDVRKNAVRLLTVAPDLYGGKKDNDKDRTRDRDRTKERPNPRPGKEKERKRKRQEQQTERDPNRLVEEKATKKSCATNWQPPISVLTAKSLGI